MTDAADNSGEKSAPLPPVLATGLVPGETWVFAYGSLLWNPGFEPQETVQAGLTGFARSFCMWSIHHRGSEEEPGLVLALDAQATADCEGVAFRIASADHDRVVQDLRERELVSSAYEEHLVPLTLRDGRDVQALAYVINRAHVQYCTLEHEHQAQVIARAVGGRGPNTEYLYNTAAHLAELGIEDPDLTALADRVRQIVHANAAGA